MNPLKQLERCGQSIWIDYIRRDLMTSGELGRLIEEGLRGMTSNPTIFEKAIAGSPDYDKALRSLLAKNPPPDAQALYEALAVEDIQMAADLLRPVYEQSGGADGYVSLEASPHLARDTDGTIAEARRLWQRVARPNLMIKVPATPEGIPAIEALIAEGININITLIFSLSHYEAVARAYLRGLERSAEPPRIASVASFFVSRIDTAVDRELEAVGTPEALALRGKAAVASAKLAYRRFREIFYGEPFARLRAKGARLQRPLWGSTSTKNPAYPDLLYVEGLVGRDTVNTVPPATLDALRDHGKIRAGTIEEGMEEAETVPSRLGKVGVDLNAVTEKLQEEGVKLFAQSFDQLMAALEKKRKEMASGHG